LDADGFTINWLTSVVAGLPIFYLAIGGDDLVEADVTELNVPGSTGSQSYNVGYRPDCVILFGAGGYADNPLTGAAQTLSIGYTDGQRQNCIGVGGRTQNPSLTRRTQRTDRIFRSLTTTAVRNEASFSGMEAMGFALDWITRSNTERFY